MFTHFNFLIKALILVVLSIFFLAFSALWYFSSGLPDYKKLESYEPPVSSRVYAQDGTLIAEYALEKRFFIQKTYFIYDEIVFQLQKIVLVNYIHSDGIISVVHVNDLAL